MRFALVFPPSMPPTSPPCGIAYLKAFLGGKAFDINLLYYDTVSDMLCRGELPVEAHIGSSTLEPEQLKEAVHCFKGYHFYDQEEYHQNCSIFFSWFSELHSYILEQCRTYLDGCVDDCVLHLFDTLLSPIKTYHPDLAGFSQMFLPQREFVLALAKHLHQEEISLVIGGASLWYNPEAYLSEIGSTDFSEVFDAVFFGEGELPLKAYIEGEPLETITNIVYKNSTIVKTKKTGIDDLSLLPAPDFGDFPLKDYYAPEIVLPLLTSRGCYWSRCAFCTHYKSYYTYRACCTEKVVADLKELQEKYNASYFLLADEMVHPQRFSELADSITREGLSIRLYSEAKPTQDFTKPLLEKLYNAGVRALLWGVESGTQRMLDLLDKGTSVHDIEQVLKTSHQAGIWNMVFMIIQLPTQTYREIENDIAFMQQNSRYISTFTGSPFTLEAGSYIYENPQKFGITVEEHTNPFTPVHFYKDSGGLSQAERDFLYKKYTVEFVVLSRVSWYFGKLRDHMVLYADFMSENPLRAPDGEH